MAKRAYSVANHARANDADRAQRAREPRKTHEADRLARQGRRERYPGGVRASGRETTRRYRALKNRAPSPHFTEAEFVEKCELLGGVCIYCGESKPLTADHNIPLSRRELWPVSPRSVDDITNIVPACQSCNGSKGDKTAAEYIAWRAAQNLAGVDGMRNTESRDKIAA